MGRVSTLLLPKHGRFLAQVGGNIRLARLRRQLSAQQVAERAGITRSTLRQIEKGAAGSSVGNFLQVLIALGLEEDILQLARDDVFGRKLQDARLTETRKRAPKRASKNKQTL